MAMYLMLSTVKSKNSVNHRWNDNLPTGALIMRPAYGLDLVPQSHLLESEDDV